MVSTTEQAGKKLNPSLEVDGAKLRGERLLRGLSQTEAAKRSGGGDPHRSLSRNHWSKIERGHQVRVRPSTARRLAIGLAPNDATDEQILQVLLRFASLT